MSLSETTRHDPKPRKDGGCAECGKPRRPERSRRYAKQEAERDPFCSTECCRNWHGTAIDRERTSRYYGCVSCGAPLDEFTPGCRNCSDRLSKQQRRAQELAA